MNIIIEINCDVTTFKTGIAKGWNERFGENLTYKDISSTPNKEDILSAIPYITEYVEILKTEWRTKKKNKVKDEK